MTEDEYESDFLCNCESCKRGRERHKKLKEVIKDNTKRKNR